MTTIKVIQVQPVITYVTEAINIENFEKYTGYICNGKANGQGTGVYMDGRIASGTFKDGLLHGSGKIAKGYHLTEGWFTNGACYLGRTNAGYPPWY